MLSFFKIGRTRFFPLLLLVLFSLNPRAADSPLQGFLQIRNGYFWDPAIQSYFVPRGIAYQSWNPPVGANQSFQQLDYDLLEFKKMHANSVRCEFVWGEVQTGPDTWDWSKPDHLVEAAEKLGIRLFVIIGFQYPPAWFPAEWRNINDQGLTPDVLDCIRQNPQGAITNCLPKPLYESLTTNQWSAALMPTILNCLSSATTPEEVVTCLKSRIPKDNLQDVLRCFMSDVINFEHPQARLAYSNHIAKVAARYKNRAAIGAWIMGNECAYFDLWESPTVYKIHRFIGYDPHSLAAFRSFLRRNYDNRIADLNANWRTGYDSFETVEMPRFFPVERNNPAFHDLIQWRTRSIGEFIALGAATARREDPNHLLTYSMVGGIFNGNDANNTCEDAKAIVAACKDAGAPLAFWSINNYAWASFGSELRTGDYGISKYMEELGLPVMISETGHSSTENLFTGAKARQAKALPGQIWESLISGAIGTHIFHWSDRDQFTRGYFDREKGFGIVNQDRSPKEPVYSNVVQMFRRMQEIRIEQLLGNSRNPPPDVQFFWSKAGDSGWPRANQENAMLWGALKRLGYHPGIIDDLEFDQGAYTNAPVLLLSRAAQLNPTHLRQLQTSVLPAGIHIHANADLPGQYDTYLRTNADWIPSMSSIFGIDARRAVEAYHSGATDDKTSRLDLRGQDTLGAIGPGWNEGITTWRIWHGIRPVAGRSILTHTGYQQALAAQPEPALQIMTHPRAKAAINTFAVADVFEVVGGDASRLWDIRYDILRAIYRNHFQIIPKIDVSGPGAKRIITDYRICPNGSVLLSVLNEDTTRAAISLSTPLLAGKVVENLTTGGIVTTNASATLNLTLAGDDYLLLYLYDRSTSGDSSLISQSPQKIWFENAPMPVLPSSSLQPLQIAFDAQEQSLQIVSGFEQLKPVQRILSQSSPSPARGTGRQNLPVTIPDPDLNDPDYLSTPEGGEFQFFAELRDGSKTINRTTLPVRLSWGVRPESIPPADAAPGTTHTIPVVWQELPSTENGDPTPLNRVPLWDSEPGAARFYNIILEMRDASDKVRISLTNTTSEGSGRSRFEIRIPENATPPLKWSASIQKAPNNSSLDFVDGFEGRERGLDRAPFHPWFSFHTSSLKDTAMLAQGVVELARPNGKSRVAYLRVSNSTNQTAQTGFGLVMGVEAILTEAARSNPALAGIPIRQEISLPAARAQWTNHTFAFDFREFRNQPCELELHVRDHKGAALKFSKPHIPDAEGWSTISASLADFVQDPQRPGFDPARVRDYAVFVRMLNPGAIYDGRFDNIRISGPTTFSDGFEDRTPVADFSRIAPWIAYGYDEANHNDVRLDHGIQLGGSEGSQSVFIVAGNRPDAGSYSGFGLAYTFPVRWSLPEDRSQWKNYRLAFDFKERDQRACLLEIQLKNANITNEAGFIIQRGIHFTKTYTPGPDGWDAISATADQFAQHPGFAQFDPSSVDSFVVNIAMFEKSATSTTIYVASIDNIRVDGPETIAPGQETLSGYESGNDFFGIKIQLETGGNVLLHWTGGGTLEVSETTSGPWIAVPTPTQGSLRLTPDFESRFFRLRK